MGRRSRSTWLLLLAAAALAVAALALRDRRAARELLPDGAGFAVESRGAGEVIERLEDTRFAAAFTAGPTYSWIERSEAVRAIDELRAGIGSATGYTPRRRHLLDLAGTQFAVAWYPTAGDAARRETAPWLAVGRLSLRAWPLAAAARVALRLGLGGDISREEVADSTVFTVGSGEGALHLFVAGRLLVAANDRGLVHHAARLAAGEGRALIHAETWEHTFSRLPQRGDLRLWARGDLLPPWAAVRSRGAARAAGAVVSARSPVTIDAFVDAPDPASPGNGGAAAPPPLALAGPAPLFFHSSAGPAPRTLADLIDDRAAAVARLAGSTAPVRPALGRGFALAVTDAEEGGLFPRPHGIVAIGMRDADASRQALRLLFPPGARSATGRWGTVLSTRESLPLAGEFELWGAAAGDRLVLATRQALIEGLAASAPGSGTAPAAAARDRPLDAVTTINVTKLLPALRRYAPPLSGLLRARLRGAPDVSRDLELLAAVRAIAVTTGSSPAGPLSRITLEVGDLPAAR